QLDADVPVLLDDPAQDGRIAATTESGIEVDEMDPLGTLIDPLTGGVDRITVVGLGAGLALGEAHGLPGGDIHGGQQDEFGNGCEIVHGSSLVAIASGKHDLR